MPSQFGKYFRPQDPPASAPSLFTSEQVAASQQTPLAQPATDFGAPSLFSPDAAPHLTQPLVEDLPEAVRDLYKLGARPDTEEVAWEKKMAAQQAERGMGWGALRAISSVTGGDMIKGLLAGTAQGGVGTGMYRAWRGSPLNWLVDKLIPDSVSPEALIFRETDAAEVRQAFGGTGEPELIKDLLLEVALDPLTYMTFGTTAAVKTIGGAAARGSLEASRAAVLATSAANVVRRASRVQRVGEGAWTAASVGIPFVKSSKIPVSAIVDPIMGKISGGSLRSMDLLAAKAFDNLGTAARAIPGIRAVPGLSGLAKGNAETRAATYNAKRAYTETVTGVQHLFLKQLASMSPQVKTWLASHPESGGVFNDLMELGIENFDNKGEILAAYANTERVSQNIIKSLADTNPEFKALWDVVLDTSKAGSSEWAKRVKSVYDNFPEVAINPVILDKAKLVPRFGLDIHVTNLADLSESTIERFKQLGGSADDIIKATPEQLARRQAARLASEKEMKAFVDLRQARMKRAGEVFDELHRPDNATLLKGVNEMLDYSRTTLKDLRDKEFAEGIINGVMENYFPRILSDAGRTRMAEHSAQFIERTLGTDNPVYAFMRQRKMDDTLLTSEINALMDEAALGLYKNPAALKRAGVSPKKFKKLLERFGPTHAMSSLMYTPEFAHEMRAMGEHAMADFFLSSPANTLMIRLSQHGKKLGQVKFWKHLLHKDSPYVKGSVGAGDHAGVRSLMEQATASGGKLQIVADRTAGVINPAGFDELVRKATGQSMTAEMQLEIKQLQDHITDVLNTDKATLVDIEDAIAAGLSRYAEPTFTPATSLTNNPALAPVFERLQNFARQTDELSTRINTLTEQRNLLIARTTVDPAEKLTGKFKGVRTKLAGQYDPSGAPLPQTMQTEKEARRAAAALPDVRQEIRTIEEERRIRVKGYLEQAKRRYTPDAEIKEVVKRINDKYGKRKDAVVTKATTIGPKRGTVQAGPMPDRGEGWALHELMNSNPEMREYIARGYRAAAMQRTVVDDFASIESRLHAVNDAIKSLEAGIGAPFRRLGDEIAQSVKEGVLPAKALGVKHKALDVDPFLARTPEKGLSAPTPTQRKIDLPTSADIVTDPAYVGRETVRLDNASRSNFPLHERRATELAELKSIQTDLQSQLDELSPIMVKASEAKANLVKVETAIRDTRKALRLAKKADRAESTPETVAAIKDAEKQIPILEAELSTQRQLALQSKYIPATASPLFDPIQVMHTMNAKQAELSLLNEEIDTFGAALQRETPTPYVAGTDSILVSTLNPAHPRYQKLTDSLAETSTLSSSKRVKARLKVINKLVKYAQKDKPPSAEKAIPLFIHAKGLDDLLAQRDLLHGLQTHYDEIKNLKKQQLDYQRSVQAIVTRISTDPALESAVVAALKERITSGPVTLTADTVQELIKQVYAKSGYGGADLPVWDKALQSLKKLDKANAAVAPELAKRGYAFTGVRDTAIESAAKLMSTAAETAEAKSPLGGLLLNMLDSTNALSRSDWTVNKLIDSRDALNAATSTKIAPMTISQLHGMLVTRLGSEHKLVKRLGALPSPTTPELARRHVKVLKRILDVNTKGRGKRELLRATEKLTTGPLDRATLNAVREHTYHLKKLGRMHKRSAIVQAEITGLRNLRSRVGVVKDKATGVLSEVVKQSDEARLLAKAEYDSHVVPFQALGLDIIQPAGTFRRPRGLEDVEVEAYKLLRKSSTPEQAALYDEFPELVRDILGIKTGVPEIPRLAQESVRRFAQQEAGAKVAAEVFAGSRKIISPYSGVALKQQTQVTHAAGLSNAVSLYEDAILAAKHQRAGMRASEAAHIDALRALHAQLRQRSADFQKATRANQSIRLQAIRDVGAAAAKSDALRAGHLKMLHEMDRTGGVTALDQLDDVTRKAIEASNDGTMYHLVDAEVFDAAKHSYAELTKPDYLRQFGVIRALDRFHGWWKPFTAMGSMFLAARTRDVAQNMTTYAANGMLGVDGFKDSLLIRRAIQKSFKQQRPVQDFLPDKVFKYVGRDGAVVESSYVKIAEEAQRRGIWGFGTVRDEVVNGVSDAARLSGEVEHTVGEWIRGAVNMTSAERNPWVRQGVRLAENLDNSSRLTAFLSQLRKGVDIDTAEQLTKLHTYGSHGMVSASGRNTFARFIPFYQFQEWSMKEALHQMKSNPSFVTNTQKVRAALNEYGFTDKDGKRRRNKDIMSVLPGALRHGFNIPVLHTVEGAQLINAGQLLALDTALNWSNRLGAAIDGDATDLKTELVRSMSPIAGGPLSLLFDQDNSGGREAVLDDITSDMYFGVPMYSSVTRALDQIRSLKALNNLNAVNLPQIFERLSGGQAATPASYVPEGTYSPSGIGPGAVAPTSGFLQEPSLPTKLLNTAFNPLQPFMSKHLNVQREVNRAKDKSIKQWQEITARAAQEVDLRRHKGTSSSASSSMDTDELRRDVAKTIAKMQNLEVLDQLYDHPVSIPKPPEQPRYSFHKYFSKFVKR